MEIYDVWGAILIIVAGFGYASQAITALWPAKAAQLGLTESKSSVDPTFHADIRGEAIWDTAILWTLPVAGVLLVMNNPAWAYFGLVGGGMYLYFAGRAFIVRRVMEGRDIRIGMPETVKMTYLFLILWGVGALITIAMAIAALHTP